MKKFISLVLSVLMLVCAVPAYASAQEAPMTEFGPYSLDTSTIFGPTGMTYTLVEDGKDSYYHGVVEPGTYQNNKLQIAFTPDEFALMEYKFMKIGYRTDSNSNNLNTSSRSSVGESWFSAHPPITADGKWVDQIIDMSGLTGGKGLPPAGEKNVSAVLKPFGSQTITLEKEYYFDIKYVAFFKTDAEAKAYTYKGEDASVVGDLMVDNYIEADDELIQQYIDKTDALIEEIQNSKTNVEVKGTKYYVSSTTGSDSNDGKTPDTAWKTISRVNKEKFASGDGVFFKRGDDFRTVSPLNTLSGVTYSAYGEGSKPRIMASVDASNADQWIKTPYENIYAFDERLDIERSVGTIVFDGGDAWGIQIQKTKEGNWLEIGTVYNGLETYTVSTGKFEDQRDLNQNLEFYHNHDNKTLYLYCKGGNPAEVFSSIEIVDKGHGISLGSIDYEKQDFSRGKDIVIDNIEVYGAGSHGIGGGNVENVIVQYCTLKWIGGSIQGMYIFNQNYGVRLGNAVESYGSSDNFVIRHCYASQVYDCCWTVQSQNAVNMSNIQMYGNVAEFCNTGLEVWQNGGTIKNMQLHDNYTRYNGYGWSHQRPNKDPNFFYGQSNTNCTYENNDIYNNVNYFSQKYAYKVGATGADQYNFHDNVYIMEDDKYLGYMLANPGKGTGSVRDIGYDQKSVAKAVKTGLEPGGMFYFVKDDPFEDMFDLYKPEGGAAQFADVADDFWGRDAINYVVLKKYFAGTGAGKFSPNSTMTRAMLVAVLSRMANGDGDVGLLDYTDISKTSWYAAGLAWARDNGIVAKGGAFRPNDPATREEMADMLYKYAGSLYKAGSLDGAKEASDFASVTATYADGVKFCTKNGIIGGYTDGTIRPKNKATRAEVSVMIQRFASYLAKTPIDTDLALKSANYLSIKGEELKKMLDNTLVRATVEGDNVKFTPFRESGRPNIDIMNQLNKNVDFAKYKYAVISFEGKTSGDVYAADVMLIGDNASKVSTGIIIKSTKEQANMIIDYSEVVSDAEPYSIIFRLYPWGSTSVTFGENEYFIVKEVALFETEVAAEAYSVK